MDKPPINFLEKICTTSQVRLNYAEGGGSGSPLVLLHGLTGRWQNWLPFLSLVNPDWHFYAVDLRGHGRSSHPDNGYLLSDYVGDMVWFLSHNISSPVTLMGHSLGAVTALFTAAEATANVRAVVLLEPPLFNFHTPIKETPFLGYFSWAYEMTKSLPTYQELQEQIRETGLTDEKTIQGMADTIYNLTPGPALAAVDDTIFAEGNLAQALQSLKCPALFLQGERSLGAAMWEEDADLVRKLCPQARVIRVPGIGHGFDVAWETVLLHMQSLERI